MKQGVTIALILTLLTALLSACGGNNNGNAAPSGSASPSASGEASGQPSENKEPVKLRFFVTDATDKQQIDEALPEFVKAYPHIQVETVALTGDSAAQQINTAILGGEQIDMLYSYYTYFLGTAPKLYLPLNDLLAEDNFDAKAEFGGFIDFATVDDTIYGLPKALAPAGIIYNSKILKELNLPEPTPDWTWDDFFELANKVKIVNGSKVTRYGVFDWLPEGYLNSALYSGWESVTADGKPNFTDPRFRQMLDYYYKAMQIDKSMPTPAETESAKYGAGAVDFFKGKFALWIAGRHASMFFDIHRMIGNLSAEDDDAGVFKLAYMPKWDSGSQAKLSFDIPQLLAISKNTEHPKEAYALLKWSTTKLLEVSAKTTHQVPAWQKVDRTALSENWFYYMDNDKQIVKGKDRTDMYQHVLDPEIVPIIPINTLKYPISAKFNDVAIKYGSLALNGIITVDEAIEKMQKEAEEIAAKEK